MTTEGLPAPQGEQQLSPVDLTRRNFNMALLGPEYSRSGLMDGVVQLQNVLLQSDLSPEKVYHELLIIADQAADRAKLSNDGETASTLKDMRQGFELTYRNFSLRGALQTSQPAQPTRTENLPPMTAAKGHTTEAKPTAEGASTYITKEQQVLNALKESKVPLSRKELAEKLGTTEGSVGAYLSRLRKVGHTITIVEDDGKAGYKLVEPDAEADSQTASQNP